MRARSERITRVGIGALDVVLLLAALFVLLVAVVIPVLGPAGFSWLNASVCGGLEMCGAPLSVTADTVFAAWPYEDMPVTNSTYDFSGPIQVQVNAYDNWSERPIALLLAGQALWGLVAFGVLILLWVILRSLRAGDPFNRRNARVVLLIAALVGIGGQLAVFLTAWGTSAILDQPGIREHVMDTAPVTLLPLACGAVIAVFAEIFRRGAVMREDVEGLV